MADSSLVTNELRSNAVVISLPPLSGADRRKLISEWAGLASQEASRLARRLSAASSVTLMREVVHWSVDHNSPVPADEFPLTAESVAWRRVQELPTSRRDALQAASLLPQPFAEEDVARLLGRGVHGDLARLAFDGFIEADGSGGSPLQRVPGSVRRALKRFASLPHNAPIRVRANAISSGNPEAPIHSSPVFLPAPQGSFTELTDKVERILHRFREERGRGPTGLDDYAWSTLRAWPGSKDDAKLAQILFSAALGASDVIRISDLPDALRRHAFAREERPRLDPAIPPSALERELTNFAYRSLRRRANPRPPRSRSLSQSR